VPLEPLVLCPVRVKAALLVLVISYPETAAALKNSPEFESDELKFGWTLSAVAKRPTSPTPGTFPAAQLEPVL
jgi:hypothetical protein